MDQAKPDKKRERLLLKLGSSTLTRGTAHISRGKIEDIARQCMVLRDKYDIVLVSSGAIATARQLVKLHHTEQLNNKQALASIGQPHLMRMYYEIFSEFGLPTAQCLLSYQDFQNDESRRNITTTIESLLSAGYLPIINENDTTATEEIKFGDNDKLAALTASLLNMDLLVMATNTYGFYDGDPNQNQNVKTISKIDNIDEIKGMVGVSKSDLGSGGMKSKIEAAEIATNNGIETWLIYGYGENFLLDAMENKVDFTTILAK